MFWSNYSVAIVPRGVWHEYAKIPRHTSKMPSPKVIYASNESKSVLARNLEECRDNDKLAKRVFIV